MNYTQHKTFSSSAATVLFFSSVWRQRRFRVCAGVYFVACSMCCLPFAFAPGFISFLFFFVSPLRSSPTPIDYFTRVKLNSNFHSYILIDIRYVCSKLFVCWRKNVALSASSSYVPAVVGRSHHLCLRMSYHLSATRISGYFLWNTYFGNFVAEFPHCVNMLGWRVVAVVFLFFFWLSFYLGHKAFTGLCQSTLSFRSFVYFFGACEIDDGFVYYSIV